MTFRAAAIGLVPFLIFLRTKFKSLAGRDPVSGRPDSHQLAFCRAMLMIDSSTRCFSGSTAHRLIQRHSTNRLQFSRLGWPSTCGSLAKTADVTPRD